MCSRHFRHSSYPVSRNGTVFAVFSTSRLAFDQLCYTQNRSKRRRFREQFAPGKFFGDSKLQLFIKRPFIRSVD